MKQLKIMMIILFIINLGVFLITLFISKDLAYIIYSATLLCNLAVFTLSYSLIHKEKKKQEINS